MKNFKQRMYRNADDGAGGNGAGAGDPPVTPPQAYDWSKAGFEPSELEYYKTSGFIKDDTTPEALAKNIGKSYQEMVKFRGADEKSLVKLPGEKATPEEIKAFHQRLGTPETPEGYEFKAPDGTPALNENMVNNFRGVFHELGLSGKQGSELFGKYIEYEKQLTSEYQAAQKAQYDDAIGVLKSEWGNKYDEQYALAQRGGKALGWSAEMLDAVGIPTAELYRGLAKIGAMTGEDFRIEGGSQDGLTKESAAAELERMKNTPETAMKILNKDPETMKRFKQLSDAAHGTQPIHQQA
jgi:hypothetical protein